MDKKLYIVGIGPGDKSYILPIGEKVVEESDVIIGGKRNLEMFGHLEKEKITVGNNLEEICSYIKENINRKKMSVLASGDSGVYGILEFLKRNLNEVDFEVIPGISSFQYLCSKLKISWQDIHITSLHGRDNESFIELVQRNRLLAVFTGGYSSPDGICRKLMENNLSHITVSVGENLSYPDEKITTGTAEEISKMNFSNLSIMIIINSNSIRNKNQLIWNYKTPGLPDNMFVRGDVPMTKEEVRAVTISKLRLGEDDIVYDIGAGTGSVTVECGLNCIKGIIYAIEKEKDALELIRKNADRFGLDNVRIIEGSAPEILYSLPAPTRVFIGGSCGKMDEILEFIKGFNKAVRVVVNAVAIESVHEAIKGFEEKEYKAIDIACISVSRSRSAGSKHLMQALNPVYIISAEYGGT